MSSELVMPSDHLILCYPLLLPPTIFPSVRVFSSELALGIRWPKNYPAGYLCENKMLLKFAWGTSRYVLGGLAGVKGAEQEVCPVRKRGTHSRVVCGLCKCRNAEVSPVGRNLDAES